MYTSLKADVLTTAGAAIATAVGVQVRGKSGVYITFAKTYCSCQAHYYEVVCKSEAPYVSCLSAAGLQRICAERCLYPACPSTVYSTAVWRTVQLAGVCQRTEANVMFRTALTLSHLLSCCCPSWCALLLLSPISCSASTSWLHSWRLCSSAAQ
jgi:hypothetical protein